MLPSKLSLKFIVFTALFCYALQAHCKNAENIKGVQTTPVHYLPSKVKLTGYDQFGIGGDYSHFGRSVAIDGDLMVVGAPEAAGHGLVFVYKYIDSNWTLDATLTLLTGDQGDDFGYSVSIKGNRIVVGAVDFTVGFDELGAAFIFELNQETSQWSQTHHIMASDGERNDKFGSSIVQTEDMVLIGAPEHEGGQVYVYKLVGNQWLEHNVLVQYGAFGNSMAIEKNLLAVGAREDSEGLRDSGAIYLFQYDGKDWVFSQKIKASDAQEYAYFGTSVELNGETLVVGANKDRHVSANLGPGAVYVFNQVDSEWQETQKLKAQGETDRNLFGTNLVMHGERIYVSSIYQELDYSYSGHVFEFNLIGENWVQSSHFGPFYGSAFNEPEFPLVVTDGHLVIGNFGDGADAFEAGSVSTFYASGEQWIAAEKINMLPGSAGDYFGGSSSVNENHMMIGARRSDDWGYDSGSVYYYFENEGSWESGGKIFPEDPAPYAYFGGDIDLDGNQVIIGSAEGVNSNEGAGAAYIFSYDGNSWVQDAKLTASDGLSADFFGISVSLKGDLALIGASGSDTFGDRSGAAYIFKKENGVWSELKKLVIPNATEDGYLGIDLDISEDWAVVGQNDAAHLFSSKTNWSHHQTITGTERSRLGSSVAIDDNTVLIGPFFVTIESRVVVADFYSFDGDLWQIDQRVLPELGAFAIDYRTSALSGDNAIIGLNWTTVDETRSAGAAYWYKKEAGVWQAEQMLVAAERGRYDSLGSSVSLAGEQAVIGVFGDDDFGTNSGAVYLFEATDVIFKSAFE